MEEVAKACKARRAERHEAENRARQEAECARITEERAQLEEISRRVETAHKAEEVRGAEEVRKLEEVRRAEEARRVEETRKAEEARKLEELRKERVARRAVRKLEEVRRAEEAHKAEETRRLEEPRKERAAWGATHEEVRRAEEAQRIEEVRKAEEACEAEEARCAEEAHKAEEACWAEEEQEAEAIRQTEEVWRKTGGARKAQKAQKIKAAAAGSAGNSPFAVITRYLETVRQTETDRKAEEARKECETKKAARLEKPRRAQQLREQEAEISRKAVGVRVADEQRAEDGRRAAEERRIDQGTVSQEARRERRWQQAELAWKVLEAEREAEAVTAAFDSEAGANESNEETVTLTCNEISDAISEGTQMSRLERRRRSGKAGRTATQTEAPVDAKDGKAAKDGRGTKGKIAKTDSERVASEQPASFGSKEWAIQGVVADAAMLVAIGAPILATNNTPAITAQNSLSCPYIGGETKEKADAPAALIGDANAQARSMTNELSHQAKENESGNETTTCSAAGVAGARAAFAGFHQGGQIVVPLQQGVYRLMSAFGYRVDPIYGDVSMHTGRDFAVPMGTPIHAVTDGVATHASTGIRRRSGNLIIVKHETGGKTYYTWYTHIYDSGALVKKDDTIKVGQVTGKMGSNGNSTGPHLHPEVYDQNDKLMNPVQFPKDQKAVDVSQACG